MPGLVIGTAQLIVTEGLLRPCRTWEAELDVGVRDVAVLKVARVGRVAETGDPLRPFVLLDENGAEVPVVSEFLHHMLADDARPSSLRSYAYELLAWFRFLRAIEVAWDAAGRAEARDFALWLKTVKKPARPRRPDAPAPGTVNPLTGKATPGRNYAPRTRRHARAAIRSFYEYHREMHGRPLINPFPQAKGIDDGSLNAHHNPMQPFRQPPRRAAYQPKEPKPAPRSIPDQAFNELFAGLTSNRDRALIAFYISTGARAAELLARRRSGAARPRRPDDRRGPQGQPRTAAPACLGGCVCLAAALPAGDAEPDPARAIRTSVVDAATAVPAADL
jgi:hypothetical protein